MKTRLLFWMLFWQVVFVFTVLPWAWLPAALDWGRPPKWATWVWEQANGQGRLFR